MVKVGRNAPCPCGSGRRYKGCCEQKDERKRRESRKVEAERAALISLHRDASDRILDWLVDIADVRPEEKCPISADELGGMNAAWSAYDAGFLDIFLEAEGAGLPTRLRAWMEAQRDVRLGLWEVLGSDAGRTLRLRDRLTGEECVTDDVTESLLAGEHIVARLVHFEGRVVIAGSLDSVVPPEAADVLESLLRAGLHEIAGLPKRRMLRREEMRPQRVKSAFLSIVADVRAVADSHEPALTNTDGDALLLTEDLYVVPHDAAERIARIEGASGTGNHEWHVLRDDHTVLARLELDGPRLTVFTNSEARADAMRRRVIEAIPTARHQGRSAKPPDLRAAATMPAVEAVPALEEQAAIQAVLDQHYSTWADVGLPALDGKTPRQAAKTRRGREELERLFASMESTEARQPEWQRYGVARLRATVGM